MRTHPGGPTLFESVPATGLATRATARIAPPPFARGGRGGGPACRFAQKQDATFQLSKAPALPAAPRHLQLSTDHCQLPNSAFRIPNSELRQARGLRTLAHPPSSIFDPPSSTRLLTFVLPRHETFATQLKRLKIDAD
jgi:hypothetical protein